MRYVRIVANATIDNPQAPPLIIDAIVDDDDEIIGRHALFGVQGSFERRSEHFEPFVIDSKGKVDWGDGFDNSNDRFGHIDLRSGPAKIGRMVELRTDRPSRQVFRISKIVELPASV